MNALIVIEYEREKKGRNVVLSPYVNHLLFFRENYECHHCLFP